jgi:hypothetical protein
MPAETPREAAGSETSVGTDPVIEAYKRGIDRTLLRENLKLTVEERFEKLRQLQRFAAELRQAGRRAGHDRLFRGVKHLVEMKRAAGRPHDLEVVAELEALLEETQGSSGA